VQNAAAPDQILLSAWNREYRRSLAIIVVGIVVLVAISAFGFWATSTGNYPTSGGTGLAIYLVGTAGFMLIVLGGSWAYTNRRLLQLSGRKA
jgi:hypothetical protein